MIDRRDVIALLPNMTLRKFKVTSLYRMLRIHERKEHRKLVLYPRTQVNRALKIAGYEHQF